MDTRHLKKKICCRLHVHIHKELSNFHETLNDASKKVITIKEKSEIPSKKKDQSRRNKSQA